MAGPWERFAPPAQAEGPWTRFAASQVDDLPLPPPPAPEVPPRRQPVTTGEAFATGLADPLYGVGQALANSGAVQDLQAGMDDIRRRVGARPQARRSVEEANALFRDREAEYQSRRAPEDAEGVDWARLGGQTVTGLATTAAGGAGTTLLGAAARGAATNAAYASLTPVADTSNGYAEAAKANAETGAVIGAVTGPVGLVVGRAIAPRLSPAVRQLADEGVVMTPGQIVGGVARRVEDQITSIPLVGGLVRDAQRRSTESFNRAAGNRVLEPLGERMAADAPVGREMIETLGGRVGQAYDDAIAQVRPFGPDQQFAQDVAGVSGNFLTPNARQQFNDLVRDRVMSRFGNGTLDGATARTIDSDLGRMAATFRSSADVSQRELGGAFGDLQVSIPRHKSRQNPQAAPQIDAANQAYGNLLRVQGAAGGAGAVEGVFSPAQLGAAVRQGDRTLRHRAYAQGNALMQDLSDAGRVVLPSKVPDSGSAGRIATLTALTGGAGAAGYLSNPLLAAAGGMGAAYSAPGQRFINALFVGRRPGAVEATGNLVARSGPGLGIPLNALSTAPPDFAEYAR